MHSLINEIIQPSSLPRYNILTGRSLDVQPDVSNYGWQMRNTLEPWTAVQEVGFSGSDTYSNVGKKCLKVLK
jgi:hypothetical protein